MKTSQLESMLFSLFGSKIRIISSGVKEPSCVNLKIEGQPYHIVTADEIEQHYHERTIRRIISGN